MKLAAQETRLDSGVRVVTVPLQTARAHAAVLLRGGPVFEDDQTWGLSHFLEHMVFRGAGRRRDARAVALAADDFGGEVGGATYRDRVLFDTRFDEGREREALALLGDMILRPRFEGLEVERDVIREELFEILDDDGQEIDPDNIAFARLFDGEPLARSIDGTEESLDDFDDALLRAFHHSAYRRETAIIAVAGAVDHRAVVEGARAAFTGEDVDPRPVRAPRARRPRRRVHTVRTDASQTQIRLHFRTAGHADRDRAAIFLLTRVLDDGPSTRFPSRLIDGEGLAYSLWCSIDNYDADGVVDVGAQVQHERVVDVIHAVARELRAVRDRVPTPSERRRAVERYARDLRDLSDRPGPAAETAARAAQLGRPFDPSAWVRELEEVTATDLRRAARRVLRFENLTCVLVGLPTRKERDKVEAILKRALS